MECRYHGLDGYLSRLSGQDKTEEYYYMYSLTNTENKAISIIA